VKKGESEIFGGVGETGEERRETRGSKELVGEKKSDLEKESGKASMGLFDYFRREVEGALPAGISCWEWGILKPLHYNLQVLPITPLLPHSGIKTWAGPEKKVTRDDFKENLEAIGAVLTSATKIL